MVILVVDDDQEFRSGLAENLRDDGHEVREFGTLREIPPFNALASVQAVISDYQLPNEENGLAFADAFHASHPEVPVVLITAYWSQYLATEAERRRYLHLCRKPVDYEELHELLHRVSGTRHH